MPLETIIAPSILSADFARLAEESLYMKECGADWLHVDCMDGHFVPNLTIGAPVVKSLRKHTDMFIDCHLMVSNPSQWVDDFAKAGASGFTFHIEVFSSVSYDKDEPGEYSCHMTKEQQADLSSLCTRIRSAGLRVGLAIRPRTPVSAARALLDEGLVDMLLIMTVEPGFGGQKFMTSMTEKVRTARKLYPDLAVQVDGGIAPSTVAAVADAGANVFVAGSAIFGAEDPKIAIASLRNGGKAAPQIVS